MTSNEELEGRINITEEQYMTIVYRISKNKSKSSMIKLPDDDGTVRNYKVRVDDEDELYLMRDGLKCCIFPFNNEKMEEVIIHNQISYMKDELAPDRRKKWQELINSKASMKGLKIWVNMQNKVRSYASAMLGEECIPVYKQTKHPRVKQQMEVLIAIIKYDIENIQEKFDIYKEMCIEDIMDAEQKSRNNDFAICCVNTHEVKTNEEAYVTYCDRAKKRVEHMTELVAKAYLCPLGPPPEMWDRM